MVFNQDIFCSKVRNGVHPVTGNSLKAAEKRFFSEVCSYNVVDLVRAFRDDPDRNPITGAAIQRGKPMHSMYKTLDQHVARYEGSEASASASASPRRPALASPRVSPRRSPLASPRGLAPASPKASSAELERLAGVIRRMEERLEAEADKRILVEAHTKRVEEKLENVNAELAAVQELATKLTKAVKSLPEAEELTEHFKKFKVFENKIQDQHQELLKLEKNLDAHKYETNDRINALNEYLEDYMDWVKHMFSRKQDKKGGLFGVGNLGPEPLSPRSFEEKEQKQKQERNAAAAEKARREQKEKQERNAAAEKARREQEARNAADASLKAKKHMLETVQKLRAYYIGKYEALSSAGTWNRKAVLMHFHLDKLPLDLKERLAKDEKDGYRESSIYASRIFTAANTKLDSIRKIEDLVKVLDNEMAATRGGGRNCGCDKRRLL